MAPEPGLLGGSDALRLPTVPAKAQNASVSAQLVGAIYDTVHDDALWGVFLDAFLRAVSADKGSLVLRDLRTADLSVMYWRGWTDEDIALYAAEYALADPWNVRARGLPAGFVARDDEYCPRADMESTAAYLEFYAPRDCCHGFGGMIFSSPDMEAVVAVVRGKSAGRFEDRELQILRELMPHLHSAVLLKSNMNNLRMVNSALKSQVNGYPHGFFLLDSEGRVLYENAAAKKVLDSGDGLALRGRRLTACSAQEHVGIEQAVASCSGRRESARTLVTCGGKKLQLMFFPERASGIAPGLMAVVFANLNGTRARAPEVLQQNFGLTKSEGKVAMKLAEGLDLREIAQSCGVSVETVRTHLRRIMSKTGTNRQGALVALVLKSLASA